MSERVSVPSFLRRVFRDQPLRFTLVIVTLGAVGLLEGAGVALLIPLLHLASEPSTGQVQAAGVGEQVVSRVLSLLGLPFNLVTVLLFTLSIVLLQQAMTAVQQKLTWGSIYGFEASLRKGLYARVFEASWPFFVETKSSDLMNALTVEANRASTAYLYLTQMLGAGFVVFVYVLIALYKSWQMTLIIAVVGLVLAVVLRGRTSMGADFGLQVTETNADLQSESAEHIAGAKLVKGTASEAATTKRFAQLADILAHVQYRAGMNQTWLKIFYDTASSLGIFLGIYLGVARFHMSIDSLVVFLFIFYRISPRLSNLQSQQHIVLSFLASAARVDELRERAARFEEPDGDVRIERFERAVSFDDVSFSYTGDRLALADVDLEVRHGKIVAIVGPSGAGKTTVVDLLMALIVPTSGQVSVDGVALPRLERCSWRARIGYVAQDSWFFNASVRENITGGREDISPEEVRAAARLANADEFVEQLPEGYETVIGDRGVRLSGGQRQRLALARAIVRQPDLLILDEATSALDAESETKILAAVDQVAQQCTVVIVTHRLAAVRSAGTIYFMEKGRVVEKGTWAELSAPGHRFAELRALQELS